MKTSVLLFLASVAVIWSHHIKAKVNIAIVGKTKNDSFYMQSFKGCSNFAKSTPDLNCIYDGPNDYQDVRSQAMVVEKLLDKNIDGLLISITDSQFLANTVLKQFAQRQIPVITFDSDLAVEHQEYRLAYVGTDNFEFGKALGKYALKYKRKQAQSYCILSGHRTSPNLNARVNGVNDTLSGPGWFEHERCTLYSMGKRDVALFQLESMIKDELSPVLIAVAGFAQFNPNYIETIKPYKQAIAEQKSVIISADTELVQLQALKLGLSTANVGQMPYQMGRKGAELMYQVIKTGMKPEQSEYYLDFHYCTAATADNCTKNY